MHSIEQDIASTLYGTDSELYADLAITSTSHDRKPRKGDRLPLNVLKLIRDIDPTSPNNNIFTFEDPSQGLTPDELHHITHHIGPTYGPEEVAWPSPLYKVLYLAHLDKPTIYPNLPEYRHSCPEIDKLLMGAVPDANFTDIGRAGIGWFMPKAYGYVINSLRKFVSSNGKVNLPTDDPQMVQFLTEFGLIGCIPMTDRPRLFQFADQHSLTIHSIGGSSIAESFNHICAAYGNASLKREVSQLSQGEGWLNQHPRNGTSKISSRFRQFMGQHYPAIHQLFIYKTTPSQLADFLKKKYGADHPHPHVQLVADLMKEMVDQQTRLPDNPDQREKVWQQLAYKGNCNNKISTADFSELVLSSPNTQLPPMPWRSFILFPHGQGEKTYATLDQLHQAAQLIKKYYPNATVFIPTRNDVPFAYDPKIETHNTTHSIPSGPTATIATIAHLTLGAHIQTHLSRGITPPTQ